MAKLKASTRNALADSTFALKGRKFPLNNKSHDRAAIRDAPISLHAGNISKSQERTVIRKAKAKLGKKKK
jgi:hypothetical protein